MSVLLLCGGEEEIVTGTVTVSDWAGSVAGQSTPAQKLVLPPLPPLPPLHHHEPPAHRGTAGCCLLSAQTAE